jgi:retron-type reverse transcriptase
MATKIVMEPIFEADFEESSYGFRPKRSAVEALEAIRKAGNQGYNFVLDADIRSYLDHASYCTPVHEFCRKRSG